MSRSSYLRLALLACGAVLSASAAEAQATRTWVSGTGSDANPCSRTAPCTTFAGAFSKTAINGEIDLLDPQGAGTITITKSITLDGTTGSGFASILANGGINAIVVNIAVNASDPLRTARIRNLSLNGTGSGTRSGLNGIRIIDADKVYVENVVISDFTNRGISDERTTGGQLYVKDTIVRNVGASGIVVLPSSGSTTIRATIENVVLEGNVSTGLVAAGNSRVTARNTVASGNTIGFSSESAGTELNLVNCLSTSNGTGVQNGAAGASITRLSNCEVYNNTTNGISNLSGSMLTYGNNKIGGNAGNQTVGLSAAVPGQQ